MGIMTGAFAGIWGTIIVFTLYETMTAVYNYVKRQKMLEQNQRDVEKRIYGE